MSLDLSLLPGRLAVARLPAAVPAPNWALAGSGFLALTRAGDELSVVAEEERVPERARADRGWRAIRVDTPLDLSMTGVLASLASPLADAGVPTLAISTHDTDYLLVKDERLEDAAAALTGAGHRFADPEAGTEAPIHERKAR